MTDHQQWQADREQERRVRDAEFHKHHPEFTKGMNTDACKPQGEHADAPNVELRRAAPYEGVRCMCVLTGCRAGPGCPHYSTHCQKHIDHIAKATGSAS